MLCQRVVMNKRHNRRSATRHNQVQMFAQQERCMNSIAVVIVNYNTRELLRNCLATVQAENPSEVVVVDNASSDQSVAMVQAEYPWVLLHPNRSNIGYGAAANQGIASCTAKYVLLLNSDTLLPAGALNALTSYLDGNMRVAIVGPRLVNSDGTLQASCYPFPGTLSWFLDNDDLAWLVRRVPVLRNRFLRTWCHTRVRVVPWVKGAAVAIRRSAFEQVKGFDESFFLYFEETDFCHRLKAAGWQTHFAPVTSITHIGEASTAQRCTDMTVQLVASNLKFCQKHYSVLWFTALGIIMRGTVLARLMRDVIRLRVERDPPKSRRIAADLAAWVRVLVGGWPEHSLESIPGDTPALLGLPTSRTSAHPNGSASNFATSASGKPSQAQK
jgi:GT2 family glycosyltransferase